MLLAIGVGNREEYPKESPFGIWARSGLSTAFTDSFWLVPTIMGTSAETAGALRYQGASGMIRPSTVGPKPPPPAPAEAARVAAINFSTGTFWISSTFDRLMPS